MTPQLQMNTKSWGQLMLLSVLWGGSFLFIEIGLEELPPVSVVAVRVSLAAVFAIIFMKLTAQKLSKDIKLWQAFFIMALFNNVMPFLLITWGQQHILGGVAAIINASTPVFTIVVAQMFTKDEKLNAAKVVGLAVAVIGVSLVIGFDAVLSFSSTSAGQIAIVGASVSYAIGSVYGRRFGRAGIAPLTVTTGQLIAGTLVLLPLAFFLDPELITRSLSTRVVMALLALAILSTALAYLIYFRLIATAGATNATLVTIIIPVTASVLTWLVLDEQLPKEAFLGMTVISLGLLILDGRTVRWIRGKLLAKGRVGSEKE